ncbi:MAG: sensor histidine kinase [Chroococcales cyanobacterium]
MTPDQLQSLLKCCRDEDTFRKLQTILAAKICSQQTEEHICFPVSLLNELTKAAKASNEEVQLDYLRKCAEMVVQWKTEVETCQQNLAQLNTELEKQVKQRTEELEKKVQELEQLNRLKDDFLSTVSHELRSPLANIKMAIHMLKIAPNSSKYPHYIQILESECARETELINDLLDLQRLESGSYVHAMLPIDLSSWLPKILDPYLARAEDNNQISILSIPKDLPEIITDAKSLGRIIAELLNNACKYTPAEKRIIFKINYLDNSPDSNPTLKLSVQNETEISPQELPRIFDKFYRVPHAERGRQGGTGLGLGLVKKLITELEGTIEVTSENGWTEFTAELPAMPTQNEQKKGKRLLT